MNHRIAAALIGTALCLSTFAGPTAAATTATTAPEPPQPTQDRVSELICGVLEDLGLLDHPELADLVQKLGCKDVAPTTTTAPSTPAEHNRL